MTTESKTQANQANAQHSTGPRTEAGKAISSRNALKHGLTSQTTLIPGEDPVVYQCFSAGMLDAYQPLNIQETAHVEELTDVQWRLRRASRQEARILSAEIPDMKSLNNLGLYTSRLKRQFSTTLKEFQQMHRVNREIRKKQLEEAEIVYRADHIEHLPSTFDGHGFDFTVEELQTWISRRQDLAVNAKIVEDYEDNHEFDDLAAAA
jgi:hypothetical protein